MTTVACVFVRGHVPFTIEYVERLQQMVKRHLDRPHRFVCLTDRPHTIPTGVEAIKVKTFENCVAWWTKVQLFSPSIQSWMFTPWYPAQNRVLYLDLDTLIVSSLAPILDFPAPFALVPHGGIYRPKNGHEIVPLFNSSVMVWNAGEQAHIYENWTHAVTERLHGDQDHIGEQCPNAATMPKAWFPRLSEIRNGDIPPEAKVILAKVPKNHIAARKYQWFNEIWRAA